VKFITSLRTIPPHTPTITQSTLPIECSLSHFALINLHPRKQSNFSNQSARATDCCAHFLLRNTRQANRLHLMLEMRCSADRARITHMVCAHKATKLPRDPVRNTSQLITQPHSRVPCGEHSCTSNLTGTSLPLPLAFHHFIARFSATFRLT
jgi:hypothetical protein